jgi:sugar lactone lactonase YvrE
MIRPANKPLIAALACALLLAAATSAFPLGLEKVDVITPAGLNQPLLNPSGLYYDMTKDLLVVANTGARQVVILSRQGNAVKTLGKKEDLGFPLAVGADMKGVLYIAGKDGENIKVLKDYDSRVFEEYHTIDLSAFRRRTAVKPAAVFLNRDGNLLVADRGNRQVLIFDRNEKIRAQISDVGEPTDIFVDSSGRILVSDPGFGGIRVYDERGSLLRTMGTQSAQFREPLRVKAFVVDRRGFIWIIEETGQGIRALDSFGNQVFFLATRFFSPSDLAIDQYDNLYVLEQGTGQISIYRITGF